MLDSIHILLTALSKLKDVEWEQIAISLFLIKSLVKMYSKSQGSKCHAYIF